MCKGDIVRLRTGDEWNGLYGVIEDVWHGEVYAVFCVTMAPFGLYFAQKENLVKVGDI